MNDTVPRWYVERDLAPGQVRFGCDVCGMVQTMSLRAPNFLEQARAFMVEHLGCLSGDRPRS